MEFLHSLDAKLDVVGRLSRRTGKGSVLVVQQFPVSSDSTPLVPNIRESVVNIVGFVELGQADEMEIALELADGKVDAIFVDADMKLSQSSELVETAERTVKRSKLFFYSDTETWADAAFHFILGLEHNLTRKSLLVAGDGILHDAVLRKFALLYPHVHSSPRDEEYDVIVGASYKRECVTGSLAKHLKAEGRVYDVGIGNFTGTQIEDARSKAAEIYRLDNRAGVSSLLLAKLETDHLLNRVMGKAVLKGVTVIAGGVMGGPGDVVVDDIRRPTHIVGIADGKGFLKTGQLSDEDARNIDLIRQIIK